MKQSEKTPGRESGLSLGFIDAHRFPLPGHSSELGPNKGKKPSGKSPTLEPTAQVLILSHHSQLCDVR